MTLIVNLFGGPGIGKSAIAHGIMHELKWNKIKCEYVSEVAKSMTWEGRTVALGCQPLITGKQFHNLERLIGKVDVIVTDSPLLIGMCYGSEDLPSAFNDFIVQQFWKMNNYNILLTRECEYDTSGRAQTEAESIELDNDIKTHLDGFDINYMTAPGNKDSAAVLARLIQRALTTPTYD